MPTANEAYLDAALRHQIGLRRYSVGLVKRISRILALADIELTDSLKARLAKFEGKDIDWTGERWTALIKDVREARAVALAEVKKTVRQELGSLSVMEGAREASQLAEAIPILIEFAGVAADQLRAIVSSRPFQGKLLKDWFQTLEQQDGARLIQAIQLGMAQGEPTPQIVRRIVGTKAAAYSDGILAITRRDATTIARTAINHVSNTAREYVWEENSDIIQARVWHSTLDGRTSAVCRARDGLAAPVGGNPLPPQFKPLKPPSLRPPAHMNCRSVMVAFIDGDGLLGNRPTVTDTRTREKREVDFRQLAKEQGKDIKDVRRDWATKNVGRTAASTTYQDFLSRQSAAFQDEVLGKTKGKLFRTGKISVQDYVDRNGNELSLAQLAKTRPEVFRAAGIDLP